MFSASHLMIKCSSLCCQYREIHFFSSEYKTYLVLLEYFSFGHHAHNTRFNLRTFNDYCLCVHEDYYAFFFLLGFLSSGVATSAITFFFPISCSDVQEQTKLMTN